MAKAKRIFIPGTNMSFPSARAAAKALSIDPGNITKVLKGKRKTAGGYSFGYESNKTIYVPQTGQTFTSPRAAARSLGVKPGRVSEVLQGKVRSKSSNPKYTFVYADATRLSSDQPQPNKRTTRRTKQKEATRKKREFKKQRIQAYNDKLAQKNNEREESRQRQESKERNRRINPALKTYQSTKQELQEYLDKVNAKLKEYYDIHPHYVNYNPSSVDVLGLQMSIGYTDDDYFNTTLSNFSVVYDDNASVEEIQAVLMAQTERMANLKQVLEQATNKAKGRFWDINVAHGNRAAFALEFNISQVQMDNYAYLIWDMFEIFEQANQYQELGSDLVYTKVRDAMQGDIPAWKLAEFLENISSYMENPDTHDLDEIFAILDGYEKPSAGVWDDEGWVI